MVRQWLSHSKFDEMQTAGSSIKNDMKKEMAAGLITLGLMGCAPPSESKAFYEPFTDIITYNQGSENDPKTVLHEEEHKKRAHEAGRVGWGLRYMFDREFACEEEKEANEAAGLFPIDEHPVCK